MESTLFYLEERVDAAVASATKSNGHRQAERETLERAKAKHASTRTFVEGKEEIKHLYDVGRTLQNEFNPYRKHDSFYDFQKVNIDL